MIFPRFRFSLLAAVILLLSVSNSVLVTGNPAAGSFTITIEGYAVTGTLTDLTGHQSGVRLLMIINQTFSTTMGSVRIVGIGVWNGATADTTVVGSIDNVNGTIHACVLLTCKDANFTGSGTWAGKVTEVSASPPLASGTFQGTLDFPTLNPPRVVPVSGNWTSTLNI